LAGLLTSLVKFSGSGTADFFGGLRETDIALEGDASLEIPVKGAKMESIVFPFFSSIKIISYLLLKNLL